MAQTQKSLELPDEVYDALVRVASNTGTTPVEWLAANLPDDELKALRLTELRQTVREGFDQIERGEYASYPSAQEFADYIKAEGRRRYAGKNGKEA